MIHDDCRRGNIGISALSQLINFKTRSGSTNTIEQIGQHYNDLGILLLEDTTGANTTMI